ncbi:MAG: HIT domain-containing protein [Candidatus Woesearchaeota archaeon]
MSSCMVCDAIAGKFRSFKIYEDEMAVAFLSERPVSRGHVVLAPKQHYPILEATPDYVAGHLLVVANSISAVLFSALDAQGTNILVQNGEAAGQDTAHLLIHIIPRYSEDGINFQWQPRQLSEEQMSMVELALKEQAKQISNFEKEKPKPINLDRKLEPGQEASTPESVQKAEKPAENAGSKAEQSKTPDRAERVENYLIKQLRRMP